MGGTVLRPGGCADAEGGGVAGGVEDVGEPPHGQPHPSWITANAVPMAVAWPLLIVALFFPLSLHRYRRLSR